MKGFRLLTFLLLFLAGCTTANGETTVASWKPADVRLIDPLDAPQPSQDMVALYARNWQDDLQIRLDFLDLSLEPTYDLTLALDYTPGGGRQLPWETGDEQPWDLLVSLPAKGPIEVLESGGSEAEGWVIRPGTAVRVLRDPVKDSLEISLDRSRMGNFSPAARVSAIVTEPGKTRVVDQTDPVLLNGSAPARTAVLFAFSNAFPAYTPSQGLRRWDGAHTGPMGGRHGLYNLLRTAHNHRIPLVLLDLQTPASLAALDYQGGLELARDMAKAGELVLASALPEADPPLPDWVQDYFHAENQTTSQQYGLPTSRLLYRPNSTLSNMIEAKVPFDLAPALERSPLVDEIQAESGLAVIHLPVRTPIEIYQPSLEGPSLAMRSVLVQLALATADDPKTPMLLLGGSLPQSRMGNPQIARAMFSYLNDHPWVRLASGMDLTPGKRLLQLPSDQAAPLTGDLQPEWLIQGLEQAPENAFGQAAWDGYRAAFAPVFPPPAQLGLLRERYLGEAGWLLEAARWAENPQPMSRCDTDITHDGHPECILADDSTLVFVELDTGVITGLFTRCGDDLHQLLGSSAQLISGTSDPSEWDLQGGSPVDPGVFNGALSGPVGPYTATILPGRLTITSPDGQTEKNIELLPQGIFVEARAIFPAYLPPDWNVPLTLDPWWRFSPGGLRSYQGKTLPDRFTWEIPGIVGVEVETASKFSVRTFRDSESDLARPENPNYQYPPGHYLPYPLAVMDLQPGGALFIKLRVVCVP